MKACSLSLLVMLLAGCHVASIAEDYRWTLKAPSKIVDTTHSKLRFTVETTTPSGTPVEGIAYVWMVDWVGLHGVEHQGVSYREESIRVKGGVGTAWLRILAFDRYRRLVEVAHASINVQPVISEPGG